MGKINPGDRQKLKKSVIKKTIFIKRKLRIYLPFLLQKQFIFIALVTFIVSFTGLVIISKINSDKELFHKSSLSVPSVKNNLLSIFNNKSSCFSCNSNGLYDPYILSQQIIKNDPAISIVDIRSAQEYKTGHIKNAVNIPVYTSLNNIEGTERNENEIVNDFVKIKNKTIIIYGNSASSTIPGAVSGLLAKNDIKSNVLSIGWNEWYHLRNVWVPEGEWNTFDPNRYSVLAQ